MIRGCAFKKKIWCALFIMALFVSVQVAAASEDGKTVEVSSEQELIRALNDEEITTVRFGHNISTYSDLTVNKQIGLANRYTWEVSSGIVTFETNASLKNGTLNATGGIAILNMTPGNMSVLGNVRRPTIVQVDSKNGRVDSVTYDDQSIDSENQFIRGVPVSGGVAFLYASTNEKGKDKKISSLTINGEKYELVKSKNTYARYYSISYFDSDGNVIETKEPQTYNPLEVKRLLTAKEEGKKFIGWLSVGQAKPQLIIPVGTTGDLSFTAVFEENPAVAEEKTGAMPESGNPGRGGFNWSRRSGMSGIKLIDENESELETVEDEEIVDVPSEQMVQLGPDGMPVENAQQGQPNRPKRVSVASSRTKTNFETGSAPKTEDVGVTVEQDPAEKIRLFAIGGGVILVAVALIILLNRSKRKNSRF